MTGNQSTEDWHAGSLISPGLKPLQEKLVRYRLARAGACVGTMRNDLGRLLRASLALLTTVLMLVTTQGLEAAQDVKMAWSASNNAAIAGYRFYYRTPLDTSDTMIDVGNESSVTLEDLPPETKYFCHVTAYAANGLESGPSAEISFITRPVGTTIKADAGGISVSITGTPGRTIDIYGSSDLQEWDLVGRMSNQTGELTFPVPRGGSAPPSFYYRAESKGESFDAWLAVRGLTDPWGKFADSGLTNLQAFTSGADLFPSARDAVPSLRVVDNVIGGQSSKQAIFTYTYRADAAGFSPVVEFSTDLQTWEPAASSMVVDSNTFNGNGTRTVELREILPVGSGSELRRFYRVRFTSGADVFPTAREALPSVNIVNGIVNGESSKYATFTYTYLFEAASFSPVVEFSTDLQTWQPASSSMVEESNTFNGNGTQTVTLREILPLGSGSAPRRLYRVRYLP